MAKIPVVVVSASAPPRSTRGIFAWLAKPVAFDELLRALKPWHQARKGRGGGKGSAFTSTTATSEGDSTLHPRDSSPGALPGRFLPERRFGLGVGPDAPGKRPAALTVKASGSAGREGL